MSKSVKKVANIVLPNLGFIGGATNALIQGQGLKGALKGGLRSGVQTAAMMAAPYALGSLGTAAGAPLATVSGNAALQGPTAGSGVLGSITSSGIGSSLSRALPSVTGGGSFGNISSIGNLLTTFNQADAAEEAARLQAQSVDRAIQTQQQNTAPYRQLGEDAIGRINEIQNDRAGFIQNNELYQSLANDAEQRLLANQAAKGKVGSGGTAAALQEQLLNIGNGLVNQEINQLQSQAGIGANAAVGAANQISNLQVQQGNAQAAGTVGQANALSTGYQNQINTLLALQSLNKTPTYQQINS